MDDDQTYYASKAAYENGCVDGKNSQKEVLCDIIKDSIAKKESPEITLFRIREEIDFTTRTSL